MASFIKSEEQRRDFYKIWAYENLQFNQRVRMKLQTDLQSQQQNHCLECLLGSSSRAAWLQARWLEISEQEHRARLHNQKLLLDFQRAQDTLDDMVARTKAMNTLRVQYERYLKENFPRWQQKLKDMHVSEQSKVLFSERNYIQQMEEDQDIKADITSHLVTSKSPYQSQFPSHALLNIHQIGKDIRQNAAKCKQDHQFPPATWLTEPQPFISGLQQNNIPKDYKNLHNIKALNHHFTFSSPSDSHHQSHSPVQQKPPSIDQTWQNPWVGVRQGLIPTGHFTPTGASWPQLPVVNPVPWGMMDVPDSGGEKIQCSETDQENPTKEMLNPPKENKQRLKHRRRAGECDQLSELDCRPVHLLKDHKASEDSSMSFEVDKVLACGMKHRRKKRRDRTQSHLANEQESQCSSSVSQNALLSASGGQTDPKRRVNHQKPSARAKMDTSKESINAENDVDGVIQDEEEKEESWDQEKPLSSDKTDGTEELNQKHSTEEEDTDEGNNIDLISEDKISDRKVADESEEEEGSENEEEPGLDEAQGSEEEGSERVVRNRDDLSDGEEREKGGDISSNIPDSDSEEGGEKTEEEIEENSSQDELIKGTQVRNDQNESEEEESDKIVHVQIHHNSLMMMKMKELQAADETEEEEVYNQEIEEDDETVIKQAYLWSKHTLYDQTKCHDDDDDNEDIEIFLKPQVNSQIHPKDDVEKTKQPNDLPSDSSVEDTPEKTKNEPAESDDEFDHFYD